MRTVSLAAVLAITLVPSVVGAASPVVVDAEGRLLGFYVGPNGGEASLNGILVVVSQRGYIALYSSDSGDHARASARLRDPSGVTIDPISAVYFASSDCTGQPYTVSVEGFRGGVVAGLSGVQDLYYIPKNSQPENLQPGSVRYGHGICTTDVPGVARPHSPIFPNDPNVTGVSNESPVGPLRIEIASVPQSSFDVFRDGFERAEPAVVSWDVRFVERQASMQQASTESMQVT